MLLCRHSLQQTTTYCCSEWARTRRLKTYPSSLHLRFMERRWWVYAKKTHGSTTLPPSAKTTSNEAPRQPTKQQRRLQWRKARISWIVRLLESRLPKRIYGLYMLYTHIFMLYIVSVTCLASSLLCCNQNWTLVFLLRICFIMVMLRRPKAPSFNYRHPIRQPMCLDGVLWFCKYANPSSYPDFCESCGCCAADVRRISAK